MTYLLITTWFLKKTDQTSSNNYDAKWWLLASNADILILFSNHKDYYCYWYKKKPGILTELILRTFPDHVKNAFFCKKDMNLWSHFFKLYSLQQVTITAENNILTAGKECPFGQYYNGKRNIKVLCHLSCSVAEVLHHIATITGLRRTSTIILSAILCKRPQHFQIPLTIHATS